MIIRWRKTEIPTIDELLRDCKRSGLPNRSGLFIGQVRESTRHIVPEEVRLKVRAVTNIEPMKNGKQRIIVTELPYMVNKATFN